MGRSTLVITAAGLLAMGWTNSSSAKRTDSEKVNFSAPAHAKKSREVVMMRDIDSSLHKLSSGELRALLPGKRVRSGHMPQAKDELFGRSGKYIIHIVGGVSPFQASGTYKVLPEGKYCVEFDGTHSTMNGCANLYRDAAGKFYTTVENLSNKVWPAAITNAEGVL